MKNFKSLVIILFLTGCVMVKKRESISERESNQNNIEGLYQGELIPADIGEPYRSYLYISKDSVWLMNSSLDCFTVKEIIKERYENKTALSKTNRIEFTLLKSRMTLINNKTLEKNYKIIYSCINQSDSLLKFDINNFWFDGTLFLNSKEIYTLCGDAGRISD